MRPKKLIEGAVIASVYVVLTLIFAPISYGPMQVRFSEALVVLPYFSSAAIPGLFVGCLIANMLGPFGLVDMLVGSGATLISAVISYRLRRKEFLVPLPPLIINGLAIGSMLHYVYAIPLSLWACIGWVSLGELVSCYLLGYPLLKILKSYRKIFQ